MELDDAFRKWARVSGVIDGCSAGGPDRLSSLPDCLLHTIMSFLKARQVVGSDMRAVHTVEAPLALGAVPGHRL